MNSGKLQRLVGSRAWRELGAHSWHKRAGCCYSPGTCIRQRRTPRAITLKVREAGFLVTSLSWQSSSSWESHLARHRSPGLSHCGMQCVVTSVSSKSRSSRPMDRADGVCHIRVRKFLSTHRCVAFSPWSLRGPGWPCLPLLHCCRSPACFTA